MLLDKIAQALLKPVGEVVILLLGSYTILWGAWLASPFWTVFNHAALYSALIEYSVFSPEIFWGCIAIITGILTMMGIILGMPRTGYIGAAIAGWHWFVVGIFYILGDAANTGGITAFFLTILAWYIYLNCKVNYIRKKEIENYSL